MQENSRNNWQTGSLFSRRLKLLRRNDPMKDFANASFSPDQIRAMEQALEAAVATLPEPVSAHRVQAIAESILRSAQQGESDPKTLQMMALVEMQLRSDQ
jgi:hypothetical protein